MIVNPTNNGWQIIYHRAHALLAAQIASHWHNADRPERIAETIAAIAQHDDLEREWAGDHLSAAGAPLDFTLSEVNPDSIEPWRTMLADSLYRGRWVALLAAKHIVFLNATKQGQSAKLDRFLREIAKQQQEWCSALGVEPDELDRAYVFMQWCDRLSLILCQHGLPARERWLEVCNGPDGTRYDVMQREDGTVLVEPWPFRSKRFVVAVDCCTLTQLQFKHNDDLVAALKKAQIERLQWDFAANEQKADSRTSAHLKQE